MQTSKVQAQTINRSLPKEKQQGIKNKLHAYASSLGIINSLALLIFFSANTQIYANPPAENELPSGAQIRLGDGHISQTDKTLNVIQNSNKLITNWQTFNIGNKATVNFEQPSSSSIALNRVVTEGASQIHGKLNANGQVFLVNPSGITFSSNARVDVGGLVSSTLNITDEDFQNGNMVFENSTNTASVINQGNLSSANGGYIALIAPRVINEGSITTSNGTTALAAGNKVSLDFSGDQLVNLTVDQGAIDALVENKSLIQANNGTVIMSAKAADSLTRSVVNNTGVIEANGVVEQGGRILLTADGGEVNIANALDVSSENAQGGEVVVTGDAITIASNTSINASGASGGGDVLIGGDWQGSGDLPQATQVTMEQGASINASATANGDGGTVVLWSDVSKANSVTSVEGDISARGGVNGGDGGAVETSGHQVDTANITVDAGADAGTGGLWLIDPYNYSIDATAAGNISSTLNTGTSVTVTTTVDDAATGSLGGDGSDVGDITVNSAITKTAGGDATLTLKADRNVNVKESITSTSNKLNLVLWADQDGSGYGGVNFEDQTNFALAMDVTTNGGHFWIGGGDGTTTWNGLTVGDGVAFGGAGDPESGIQFVETTSISTSGGSIYMAADTSDALQVDIRFGVRTPTSIDAGGGDIELLGDKITFANASTLETSGELTIASIDTSFDEAFIWNGTVTGTDLVGSDSLLGLTINNVDSLGGLRLGKDGNSADITLNSALDINGSVNIFGGNVSTVSDWDITGSVNIDGDEIITSGVWNVGGDVSIVGDAEFLTVGDTINTMGDDVLLKNTGTIDLVTGAAITTLGGDITLWSNSDNSSNGSILLENNVTLDTRTATDRANNTHTNGGGDITLAGGLDTDSDGRPDGFAVSDTDPAIALGTSGGNTTTLYSGGGDLLIRGMGLADAIQTNHNFGIVSYGLLQADSGTGSISIVGESADSIGVYFSRGKTSGNVLDLKSSATSGTAISIVGTASGSDGTGVNFTHKSSNKILQATGGGDIEIIGTGAASKNGISLLNSSVLASSGDILLDSGVNGMDFTVSTIGALAGTDVLSSSSNLTVTGDSLTTGDSSMIDTTGTVTFDSFSDSFSELYDDLDTSITFADTISGLTIGKPSNTADVTLSTDVDINGPVTVYGGDITIENLINTEGGGAASDILLKATGNVVVNETLTFETNGGDITLWSDSDANDAGIVLLNDNVTLDSRTATDRTNNTHTNGGGDITLAGGLDTDSDGRPDGFAVSDTDPAITLGVSGTNTTTLYSGGGDLLIRGMGLADAIPTNHNVGVDSSGFLQADSGTGSISIIGESSDSTAVFFSRGKSSGDVLDLKSSATSGTAISIVGTATGSSGGGVNFTHAPSIKTLQATGGGDIVITGYSAGTSGGIDLFSSRVLASSGDILIDGGVNGSDIYNATLGALAGTDVLSSSSNITVTGDSFTTYGTSTFDTTGTVTFDSFSDSFSELYDDLDTSITFADTISGLTIGKPSNTADVTLRTDVDINGPVTVYGGNLNFDNLVTAVGGTITLNSSGTINQGTSAVFTAANLNITTDDGNSGTSAADVILQNDANDIATLTADVDGSLAYRDSNALSISRDTTNGITAQETILVETLTGDLTINDNIVTTDNSASAVILNAGKNTAAGTSTGGNIIANSSPTITVGSGGRATLYSGDVGDSTGLTPLVQSGSGRFRYNSDEAESNFTSALGAGVYGIYREQPSVLINATNETVTYGSTPSLASNLGSLQNGETSEQMFSTAPTVTISGGSTSSSGNYTVGSYNLTVSGGVDQLGYAISGYNDGTLTVSPKTITSILSATDKEYDGTTAVSIGVSGNGFLAGDVSSVVGGTGVFDNKSVGTGKTVNIAGFNLTGTDASNYVLDSLTGTTLANITKKDLTVSGLTAANKIYDGATAAIGNFAAAVYTGLLSGDDLSISSVTGTFDNKNVGTGKTVTLSTSYTGADLSNYNIIDQVSSLADISKKDLTITGLAAANKTYNQNTSATINTAGVNYGGLVSGDVLILDSSSGVFDNQNAGTGKTVTLTNSYSGADIGNYNLIDQVSALANITKKDLTVSGLTAVNKIYDGATAAIGNFAAAVYTGLLSGDDLSISSVTGTFDNKNVGTGKTVTLSTSYTGADLSNYNIIDQVSSLADISKKDLTITGLAAANKTYNQNTSATINTAEVNYGGLVSGDVLILDSSSGVFDDQNAGTDKTVTLTNSYSGADIGNYNLIDQASTLADITPKSLVINLSGAGNKVYDSTSIIDLGGIVPVVSGVLSGDDVNINTGSVTGFVDENVGTNKHVEYTGFGISGSDASNYIIPLNNAESTAVITAKALTISGISVNNKTYDGTSVATTDFANAVYTGLISGDDLSLDNVVGVFDNKNVALGKTVSLNSSYRGVDLGNYLITDQLLATANIDKRSLNITANSIDKPFDGMPYRGGNGVAYSGLAAGESGADLGGALSYSGSSQGAVNTGLYVITPGGLTSDNYAITYTDGSLQIGAGQGESELDVPAESGQQLRLSEKPIINLNQPILAIKDNGPELVSVKHATCSSASTNSCATNSEGICIVSTEIQCSN